MKKCLKEPYIDIVIGPKHHRINELVKKHVKLDHLEETEIDTIEKFKHFDTIKNDSNKVSSFLTIQEGCDVLSFCIVLSEEEYSDHLKK